MKKRTILLTLLATCLMLWSCDTKTKNVDSCGDGFVDPGEQCDTTVGENSCQSLGYYNALGTLTCTSDCQFDDSLCGGRCGDGDVQEPDDETCDGGDLNGQTCQSLGYTGGTLACGASCVYDVSGCAGRCGNGVIDADEGEVCDGGELAGETCQTQGYHGGALACEADCTGYNLDNCTAVGRCGDGVIQETYGELCDVGNLVGQTCEILGYHGGQLDCSSTCTALDETDCIAEGRCGDGTIQASYGEDCDGTALGDATCVSLGYNGGLLSCGAECVFDLASCEGEGRCGDGSVQTFYEQCDGGNLNAQTCQTLGYNGGELTCDGTCTFVLTNCEATGQCGDGTLQSAFEDCEGLDLGGQTCQSLGYSPRSGALACFAGCVFDESECVPISANADLATLTVSEGTLKPAFSPATTEYGITLSHSVVSLTVTATAADAPYATVEITPAQPMTLVEGVNPVTVTVTAEDGAQKVYAVVITRLSPNDYLSPNIGGLKYVPAGTFQRDATPTNLSTVSAFRMSQYEISRAQWVAVTGWADPSDVTKSSGTTDPVQQVSWYDAIAFCNKLSLLEGLTPVYTVSGVDFSTLTYAQIPTATNADWNAVTANWGADGYRLPTQMEWMWAAMGADTAAPGVTNTIGYAKAFAGSTGSNLIGDYAVFGYGTSETGRTTTQRSNPVGTKLANELGFQDLSGNVNEWTWDWSVTYPTGTVTDYRGPASGIYRVIRGGGWSSAASTCAVAYRGSNNPYFRGNVNVGFRVVRP